MKFFRHLSQLLQFLQLPRARRQIVFYSEGRAYWVHLEPLLRALLENTEIGICYITSARDDPGLTYTQQNFSSYLTDDSWIRNWLFENIDTDVLIMTMPDLDQYQIKRSRHPVHYVYLQHSLISLHMGYRKGAFDHFDTVLCAGPYQQDEIRATEACYGLPAKHTIAHSYSRLFKIIEQQQLHPQQPRDTDARKHVLIAPSWGTHCLIETGAEPLLRLLLAQGFTVTLRPHPQTKRFAAGRIAAIKEEFDTHPLFTLETDVASQDSLQQSDIMISDWSGAALEYALGLGKPVLFIDTPRKINNPDYQQIGLQPFEDRIREQIGSVLPPEELHRAPEILSSLIKPNPTPDAMQAVRKRYLFDPGTDQAALKHIIQYIRKHPV